MDDGKEVYANFAYNAIKQTEKGMALILRPQTGLPKKNPKYSCVKV
jgi:hypothetical protein